MATLPTPAKLSTRTPAGLIAAIVGGSALVGVLSDAAPVGNTWGDIFWTGLAAATLARATANARRWSWFPMAGAAAALAQGALALAFGVGALAGVFAAGFFAARRRWIGALVGALAAQALLRGYSYGFTGLPTMVAFAACAPMLVSAYANSRETTKRSVATVVVVGAAVIAVLSTFTVVSALRARDRVAMAIDFGNQAVTAAQAGDQVLAASLIGATAEELDSVATDFDRPWLYPARFVPLLGPHATVLSEVTSAGAAVADDAVEVLVALDPDTIVVEGGLLDLAAVNALVRPMARLRETLEVAVDDVVDLDQTWLADSAEQRVEQLVDELVTTFDDVEVAHDLLAITPDLLGAGASRRYLVMFMTPAESRGAGGFAGNWAELVVDNGRIELTQAGRSDDINTALPQGGIAMPDTLRGLYDGFELETTFQNLPVVPDFPTVANLAKAQYQAATGTVIDAVIGVDHAGIAGVVALTGPIDINGAALNAAEVEQFVLRGQYQDFADDNDARLQALEDLTFTVFDRLVDIELPSPSAIIDVFKPLVVGDHLRVVSFDNAENAALEQVALGDAFAVSSGQDLLAVITQNLGENKIDVFLERHIAYDVTISPNSNTVHSRLSITLTNSAPEQGLPQAIIGNNDQGLPMGTNRARVQVYSALQLQAATLDGADVAMTLQTELGWSRYVRDLWLDPGQTEVLVLEFEGLLDLNNGYVLAIEHQPLANLDQIALKIDVEGADDPYAAVGVDTEGRAMITLQSDELVGLLLNG